MSRHSRTRARATARTLRRVSAAVVATAAVSLVVGLAVGGPTTAAAPDAADAAPTAAHPTTPRPAPAAPSTSAPAAQGPVRLSLVAAGDVLPHGAVLRSAERAATGGDDAAGFATLLSGIDPWVRGADLALCHFEVPVVPPGGKVSTYPTFGVPAWVVDGVAEQGWDGCSNASNHSLDRGFGGLEATLDAFDAAGLGHTGTARTAGSSPVQTYRLVRGGRTITVAHVSATYGLNGSTGIASKPWAVERLDVDRIVAQARAARRAGADVVVASVHAGTEYVATPTSQQRDVARALARSGQVDVVLGAHAHVPQPVEKLPGGVGGRGMWVVYGMGNLISNQDADCCSPSTDSGLLVTVTLAQDATGDPVRVADLRWTGVTVDRLGGHRVYAFADVLDDPDGVGTLSHAELERRYARLTAAVGAPRQEASAPPTPTGPAPQVIRGR